MAVKWSKFLVILFGVKKWDDDCDLKFCNVIGNLFLCE